MNSRFSFIKTGNHLTKLRKFEVDGKIRESKKHTLQILVVALFDRVKILLSEGNELHDRDLQFIALTLNHASMLIF